MAQPTQHLVRQKKRRVHFDGSHMILDQTTGEVFPASVSMITGGDADFLKLWVGNILVAVNDISNSKIKVLMYIISNMDRGNNELRETTIQIAAGAHVSLRTVSTTLGMLHVHDIIRRRPACVTMNPDVIMQGSAGKRQALLIRFQQLELPLHKDFQQYKKPRRLQAVS